MISSEDRNKYPYHTDGAILGIKFIGGLQNKVLRLIIQDLDSWQANKESVRPNPGVYLSAALVLMGHETNWNWIAGRALEEMNLRDLISDEEFESRDRAYS